MRVQVRVRVRGGLGVETPSVVQISEEQVRDGANVGIRHSHRKIVTNNFLRLQHCLPLALFLPLSTVVYSALP